MRLSNYQAQAFHHLITRWRVYQKKPFFTQLFTQLATTQTVTALLQKRLAYDAKFSVFALNKYRGTIFAKRIIRQIC